jgi:hypothetical protein
VASFTSRPHAPAIAAIVLVVLLANGLYLLDLFDANPLGPTAALTSSIHNGLLGGSATIDPNIGYTSQALGHRVALDWLGLHFPWWDPYEGTGAPLAGEMQSAALFPPTLLLAISNGQVYERMVFELVAGIATYLLLARLGLRRAASTAGGIAFALNGTFSWLANAAINPTALAPMLLLGVEYAAAAARERRPGGWWLIAVAAALSLYAGFPEVAYVNGLLAIGWWGWRCWDLGRDRARALVTKSVTALIVGALLAAPILVAFLTYLPYADVGPHSGAEGVGLPARALAQLVLPYIWGPIDEFSDPAGTLPAIWGQVGGYLTISIVLFALLGLVSAGRRGLRWVLGVWLALALSRIYGEPPLLGHLLGVVPGMGSVDFARWGQQPVTLAAVVLCALGLDSVSTAPLSGRTVRRLAMAAGAIYLAAAGAGLLLETKLSGAWRYFAMTLAGGLACALAAVLGSRLPAQRLRTAVVCGLVAVEALAYFVAPELSAPSSVQSDLSPVRYLQRNLGTARFFTLGPIQPNYGAYFGLGSLNVNDLPIDGAFSRYIHSRLDPIVEPTVFVGTPQGGRPAGSPTAKQELLRNLAGYTTAGASFVLAEPATPLPAPFIRVFSSPSAWIYRLPGATPMFSASRRSCSVTALGIASARVFCPAPATLTRLETDLPGSSAAIDGRATPVTEADGIFQSVRVGAGWHLVSFGFAPPGIGWSLAALLVGAGWLALGTTRTRAAWSAAWSAARPLPAAATGPPPPSEPEPAPEPAPAPAPESAPEPAPAPAPAPVNDRLAVGRVETVAGDVVRGWSWCPAAPGRRLRMIALVDGREAADGVADLPRPSLVAAGIGDGRHGFSITLPPGPRGTVLRVETESGVALPSAARAQVGELEIDSAPDPALLTAVGYVDEIADGHVAGWAWCPAHPRVRLAVWVVLGDRLLAGAVADRRRPSLVRAQIGDGAHAFRIELPAGLDAAALGALRVETDTGVVLPRSAGSGAAGSGPPPAGARSDGDAATTHRVAPRDTLSDT